MGVPITAAALLETILVNKAISNINTLRIMPIDIVCVRKTKDSAKKSEPPVSSKAFPRDKLATINMIIGILIALPTSLHFIALKINIAANPSIAAIDIGKSPVAAVTTTASIIYKGKKERRRVKSNVSFSITSMFALVFKLSIDSLLPWTRTTSPGLRVFKEISPVNSAPVFPPWRAMGNKLNRLVNCCAFKVVWSNKEPDVITTSANLTSDPISVSTASATSSSNKLNPRSS